MPAEHDLDPSAMTDEERRAKRRFEAGFAFETRPVTDEDTTPDRDVPPSHRDLSTHRPDCNCMGCFYRE